MSVGAHLIDADHRALIAIINELHDMLKETDGAVDHAVLAKGFKELVTYSQYHFRARKACCARSTIIS